jgi:hypothetical protein
MKISELADQLRNIPPREVLERYGFEAKPEGTALRARDEYHNIVLTGSRWFDNKAGVGGAGAIDLVIHIAKVDFPRLPIPSRSVSESRNKLDAAFLSGLATRQPLWAL